MEKQDDRRSITKKRNWKEREGRNGEKERATFKPYFYAKS
jgi:hypothetical protein